LKELCQSIIVRALQISQWHRTNFLVMQINYP
jgi:hypothetical protein